MSTMNTGDVSRRVGLTITAERLLELGFTPAGRDKRAVLWNQSDYPVMCKELGKWIAGRANVPMQPRPEGIKTKEAPTAIASTNSGTDDEEEL